MAKRPGVSATFHFITSTTPTYWGCHGKMDRRIPPHLHLIYYTRVAAYYQPLFEKSLRLFSWMIFIKSAQTSLSGKLIILLKNILSFLIKYDTMKTRITFYKKTEDSS